MEGAENTVERNEPHMKLPFCEPCVQSKAWCAACAEKHARGEATELDVRVSEFLLQNKEALDLHKAEFAGSVASPKSAFLFAGDNGAPLIGKGGATALALAKFLGKRIKVIELKGDKTKALAQAFRPLAPLGVNTVYKAEGAEYKIRVPKADAAKLQAEKSALQTVCGKVLGGPAEIVFE